MTIKAFASLLLLVCQMVSVDDNFFTLFIYDETRTVGITEVAGKTYSQ